MLDEGHYHCSIRTMYRLLAAAHEVRERRNQLRHVAPKLELLATRPARVALRSHHLACFTRTVTFRRVRTLSP